jgi:hypothetical protein
MEDVRKKTRATRLLLTGAKAKQPLELLRRGMPAQDSIHDDSVTFKSKGRTYRILKTTEVDSYENTPTAKALRNVLHGNQTPAPAAIAAAAKLPTAKRPPAKRPPAKRPRGGKPAPAAGGEIFAGQARMAAKLSKAQALVENFPDVSKLIASLPAVAAMVKLKIPTTSTSNRVKQEQRNIHVTGFLFAASREADNDFHLIVGTDPNAKAVPETYMTMEVSGLPPAGVPPLAELNTVRTAYKGFFGAINLPGAGYHFYQPPIPVQIDGSLFFDATHATGQAPGPPSLKSRMPTIWELHPITNIKLG